MLLYISTNSHAIACTFNYAHCTKSINLWPYKAHDVVVYFVISRIKQENNKEEAFIYGKSSKAELNTEMWPTL